MTKSNVFVIALSCWLVQTAQAQQPVFEEDFERGIPASFILADQDHFKPELDFPEDTAWTTWTDPDDNENYVAASTSFYSPTGSANDWMVLPMIELPDDSASCQLFWRSRSAYDTYKDGYVVLLSEQAQNSPEQLIEDGNAWKTILQVPNSQNPASWKTFYANLADYAGKKVYVAFVNNTYDGWMLFLDDITIGPRQSVRKASLQLTTERYATDGQLRVTANVKAGILDPLSGFTTQLTCEGDTIVENIIFNSVLLPNAKSEIFLSHHLTGCPATAHDFKLELLNDNNVMAADSSRVVFVAPLQGKIHVLAEGLINKSQNGGYGPRLIEGYKQAEEKYGDAFIGIEVHGPNAAEDDLAITGQGQYRNELHEMQVQDYGRGVVVDRHVHGEAYDDIDSLCQERLKKKLICTAAVSGQSDDEQLEAEARVTFGIPLSEASFKYEWFIVEDSLWATQWNMYSGGLFGPFLGYESLPLEVNLRRNGVMRDRIKTDDMRIEDNVQVGDTIILNLQHALPQQIAEPRNLSVILVINDANTGEVVNAAKCTLAYNGEKPVNGIEEKSLNTKGSKIEYFDITGKRLNPDRTDEAVQKEIIIVKEKIDGEVRTKKIYR